MMVLGRHVVLENFAGKMLAFSRGAYVVLGARGGGGDLITRKDVLERHAILRAKMCVRANFFSNMN